MQKLVGSRVKAPRSNRKFTPCLQEFLRWGLRLKIHPATHQVERFFHLRYTSTYPKPPIPERVLNGRAFGVAAI
jgi:hypothetical protein